MFIKKVLYLLLKLIGLFIPKNKNVWIFGERNGTEFGNNSKYLFIHIKNNHKDIIPVWFVKNKIVYNEVKQSGGKVYYINSLKALYYGIIAKVYIHSHGRQDIVNYVKTNSIFVNLYHSMSIKLLPHKKCNDNLDIASSELTKKTRMKGFSIQNTVITGEPRYDIFFKNNDKLLILKKYGLEKYYNKKIVSYLPTFRDYDTEYKNLFLGRDKIQGMEDVIIFEKSHPGIKRVPSDNELNSKTIIDISNLNVDSQELLAITDILITDYSACFVDFLLTDRPIILYVYDLKKYEEKRGLYYDIKQLDTGAVVFNENELIKVIIRYLNSPELDYEKRKKVKDNFHDYQDGLSSERVYQEIMKLIHAD